MICALCHGRGRVLDLGKMMLAAAGSKQYRLAALSFPALKNWASSRPRSDPQILGGLVADSLQNGDAELTATAIADSLEPSGREALLRALVPTATSALEDKYVDVIFRQADFKDGNGLLDRCYYSLTAGPIPACHSEDRSQERTDHLRWLLALRPSRAAIANCRAELKAALQADRAYTQLLDNPRGPPSIGTLSVLAIAAGLPYVGFGFVDNAIMVTHALLSSADQLALLSQCHCCPLATCGMPGGAKQPWARAAFWFSLSCGLCSLLLVSRLKSPLEQSLGSPLWPLQHWAIWSPMFAAWDWQGILR